jgi:hypothetical protein
VVLVVLVLVLRMLLVVLVLLLPRELLSVSLLALVLHLPSNERSSRVGLERRLSCSRAQPWPSHSQAICSLLNHSHRLVLE